MEEYIGKVKMNLEFYPGEDKYSDGTVEKDILELLRRGQDAQDIIIGDDRWPVLYHLSNERWNLLEWYDFSKGATILEIGAGCGALTEMFCTKAKNVVAVELSKRRADITAQRCKTKENLEIIVGNFNDIKFKSKFDYITLIGVLEYAEKFSYTNDPFSNFLNNIKELLNENGKLIIAIENRMGLKYWAGHYEDHTNRIFDGLENYPSTEGVKTFSKKELESLLTKNGFKNIEFFYPHPDYKFPKQIFSEKGLPFYKQIATEEYNYQENNVRLFNEKLVLDSIIEEQMFDFFANSFLVFCSNK